MYILWYIAHNKELLVMYIL